MEYVRRLEKRSKRSARLIIPLEFRRELGSTVVITGWFKEYLCLYPEDQWQGLVKPEDRCKEVLKNARNRRYERFLFSQSIKRNFGSQRRVSIPNYLQKRASLGKVVIVAKEKDCVEVWSDESWQKRKGQG